jgi:hypothetical protein
MSKKVSIKTDGYQHFPGFFNEKEVAEIRKMFDDRKVNYPDMLAFITGTFLKRIDANLGWKSKHTKARISNNNNSSDASVFHRDLFRISDKYPEAKDIYTCLTYLDNSTMQLIPESYLKPELNFTDALSNFTDRITIEMKPGDVLIFNCMMLHRGVFDKLSLDDNRRLIQLFEVYPSEEEYKAHNEKIVHIKSTGVRSSISEISNYLGHAPVISDIMSFISYLNASTGYGKGSDLNDLIAENKLENYAFVSSEGMQKRLDPATLDKGWGDSNLYVHSGPSHDLSDEVASKIIFQCYTKWLAIYSIFMLLILVLVIVLIYKAGSYMLSPVNAAEVK